jgi:hypothetical protein
MSEEQPVYREGETVPAPDKGGWVDGEGGPGFGGPPPEPPVAPPPEPPTRENAPVREPRDSGKTGESETPAKSKARG